MKIIERFKNLKIGLQYTIGITLWTLLCFWFGNVIGHINFCPPQGYSWECALSWVDAALVASVFMIWAATIIGFLLWDERTN